jgi:hypothetical protein
MQDMIKYVAFNSSIPIQVATTQLGKPMQLEKAVSQQSAHSKMNIKVKLISKKDLLWQ